MAGRAGIHARAPDSRLNENHPLLSCSLARKVQNSPHTRAMPRHHGGATQSPVSLSVPGHNGSTVGKVQLQAQHGRVVGMKSATAEPTLERRPPTMSSAGGVVSPISSS